MMADMLEEVRDALRDHTTCHGIVYRDGEMDACGKPACVLIDAREHEDGCIWPACAYHAHQFGRGRTVPLTLIIAAIKDWTPPSRRWRRG